ncbi:peptidase domain-containing ABC transporter [Bacillus thuringiensis]|uniref:peptidase domain-containing ABC transporter n=1 Tax=Bacillus thuringiensis TaxID=1428 RepID=UPI003BF69CF3
MRNKIKWIEQMEHSECGLACVTMIVNYHGHTVHLETLRDTWGVPKGGHTLQHLQQILHTYGIQTKGIRVINRNHLMSITVPFICLWENKHYVVVEKVTEKKVWIADPAKHHKSIDIDEFFHHFSDIVLYPTSISKSISQNKTRSVLTPVFKNILFSQKKLGIQLCVCTIVLQCLILVVPFLTQQMVDQIHATQQYDVWWIGFAIIIVSIVYYSLQVGRGLLINQFQKQFDTELMTQFFQHLIQLPLQFFTNRSTGDLVFRSNLNVYIRQIISQKILTLFMDCIFVLLYVCMMFYYSFFLAGITCIVAGLMFFVTFFHAKKIRNIHQEELVAQTNVQNTSVELIEGMETIKSMGVESYFYQKWFFHFKTQLQIVEQKGRLTAFIENIPRTLQFGFPMMLLCIGQVQVLQHQLTLGELIAVHAMALAFLIPVVSLSHLYTDILLLYSYVEKVQSVFRAKTEDLPSQKELLLKGPVPIKIEHVSFQYSTFECPTIYDINLSIQPNEKVAIVGKSGSGKSTLLKLLGGIYRPTTGKISVKETDLSTVNARKFREAIAFINQDPTIFHLSLRENIIWDDTATKEDYVHTIIKKADIHEMIQHLPLGLETYISGNGSNVSGGQRQKIAFARAFYKNPPLLLMDEPTSALDNISEQKIMNTIQQMKATCIVIAHRLQTIQQFDRIIVMENGTIVETGAPAELLKNKGPYYHMYHREFKN